MFYANVCRHYDQAFDGLASTIGVYQTLTLYDLVI